MSQEKFDFAKTEEKILKIWKSEKCFEKQNEIMKGKKEFVFYDGPPFATGLPHYGHILSGTIKDVVTRFAIQQGFSCVRRFGWDCHGLPVEYEIDKQHNINSRQEVLEMGIPKYNNLCKSIVQKYTKQWEDIVNRMARWVSFENGYKTMDINFMESIWYVFSQIFDTGRVYRGFRVMAFSTGCSTPLSNFEANQNYKEVSDPSVIVKLPLLEPSRLFSKINELKSINKKKLHENKSVSILVWTTTPWTLPSNLGVSINSQLEYSLVELNDEYVIILENRLSAYKPLSNGKVIFTFSGKILLNLQYEPPFDFYIKKYSNMFRVLNNPNVDPNAGTGIIPNSPAFGEDDYNCFLLNKLISENDPVACPINEKGIFTETDFKGLYFKDADKHVIAELKKKNKLIWRGDIVHRYPFCWRSDTPLIYKLVPNWFIKLSDLQSLLYDVNEEINWIPKNVKSRFGNWLKSARDWSISRNRFWGTPIPIWTNKDFSKIVVIKSVSELKKRGFIIENSQEKPVEEINDLHREFIDEIYIKEDGEILSRIDEVFDCWFESGSMPYAQDHWPFNTRHSKSRPENQKNDDSLYDKNEIITPKPADFIAEGLDQTRGWFYTLHVISCLLFKKPSYKNIICFGIVLAADGKKMSKRLKNYPDPMLIANKYGVDSLRLYLLSSPVVEAENLKFQEKGVHEVYKNLLINWLNCLNFYQETLKNAKNASLDSQHKNISLDSLKLEENHTSKKVSNKTSLDSQQKNISLDSLKLEENHSNTFNKWIKSELFNFGKNIKDRMSKYELFDILNLSLSFIENLSNWYIRMNRDYLKTNNKILKEVLLKFSIIMASFTPYFSEYSYQLLNGNNILNDTQKKDFFSVHYEMYPDIEKTEECNFNITKRIIEGIRYLRANENISLKTPLYECTIVMNETLSNINIIKKECNILDLIHKQENEFNFKTSCQPNYFFIKNKFNNDQIKIKNRIKEIKQLESTNLNELISCKDVILNKDIIFKKKGFVALTVKGYPSISLILNVKIDKFINEMKIRREFQSFIQKFRKDLFFKQEQKIKIWISSDKLKDFIDKENHSYDFIKERPSKECKEFLFDKEVVKVVIILNE